MMKRKLFAVISTLLLISLVLPLGACNSGMSTDLSADSGADISNSKNLMQNVTPNNITQVNINPPDTKNITDFALRLFRAGNKEGENILISPLSVLYALSMTANGAQGETLSQMEAVLEMPIDELNGYLLSYMNSLPKGDKYKLNLANSIWFKDEDSFSVSEDFLQTNSDYYGADVYVSPFDNSTLHDINNWVNDKTDGMIPDILDRIPEDAIMYLVNALAFEAEWHSTYSDSSVREDMFTSSDGTEQTVEFMYGSEGDYLETDNAKGFIKYFKDKKYAFAALLPNEDVALSELVESLDGESLNALLSAPKNITVHTAVPKFEVEYKTEMAEILKSMGMPDAFDPMNADFSKLGNSEYGNIFINRVLHKTYIEVGPLGAKAGAATAVEVVCESSIEIIDAKTVELNRPFLYMLIDCETNTPFFIGTINNIPV